MDWQTLTHKTWSGVATIMVLGAKPPRRQRQQQLACGVALEELSLDQPRRYQAELTSRGGRLVVPGNSGLEIWAGQKGRPDPRDQAWQQTLLHLLIRESPGVEQIWPSSRAGSYRWLELGHTRCRTLVDATGVEIRNFTVKKLKSVLPAPLLHCSCCLTIEMKNCSDDESWELRVESVCLEIHHWVREIKQICWLVL